MLEHAAAHSASNAASYATSHSASNAASYATSNAASYATSHTASHRALVGAWYPLWRRDHLQELQRWLL